MIRSTSNVALAPVDDAVSSDDDISSVENFYPLVLRMEPAIRLTDDQFFDFARQNDIMRMERTATGEIIIMTPTGGETGKRNFSLCMLLGIWAMRDQSGIGFDSSTAFRLPNGATRSPDAAWIERSRYEALPLKDREKFPPICPDFVVELTSPTDTLRAAKAKMREYMACGARLGWLIDPPSRQVIVYRPGEEPQVIADAESITGEPVLPGFVLNLSEIW